ncbi:MAG: glycosyltransferase family 39 protein [Candidatus Hadarchaeum sp.]
MEASRAEVKQLPIPTRVGLLVLIVLLGFAWRFVGLAKESIWLDEVTSLIIARMDLRSEIAWAAADIHPPLYYFALHAWLPAGETEFSLRALSAAFGVLAIAILYAFGRELFGPQTPLLAALLLALSPLHIWYSQEARMYSMVATLSLFSSYFLLLALRRGQMRYWLGYILTAALALYTHYFALFVLLFQNVFAFYWLWRGNCAKDQWSKWLAAGLAIGVLFLPWLPIFYRQVVARGGGWVEKAIGKPSVRILFDTWLSFNIGPDGKLYPVLLRRLAYILFGAAGIIAFAELFWGFVSREAKRGFVNIYNAYREGLILCLLYSVFPLLTIWLLAQVTPMYALRYLSPFLPPYYLFVAYGIRAVKWSWIRVAVILSLVLILLVGNWNAWHTEQRDDWRGIAAYVLAQAQPGDVVLFSPRWNAKPFDYYARGRMAINMDLPIPVTIQAAKDVVSDISQHHTRVWLIWQHGHYSDPEGGVKQVLDQQFHLVEMRRFREMLDVLLYEVTANSAKG